MFHDPAVSQVAKLRINLGPEGSAVGSAFVVCGPEGPCLATAFHNLSGGVSVMDRMKMRWRPCLTTLEVLYGGRVVSCLTPYSGGRSLFRVHPQPEDHAWCDVAIIDMAILRRFRLDEAEDSPFWKLRGLGGNHTCEEAGHRLVTDMYVAPGRDALVFGFPGGRDFRESPIALSCRIAAEAGDDEPCLLLSGYTSSGCSGGPVLMREFGGYLAAAGNGVVRREADIPLVDQWLGLYSGRLAHMTNDAQRHWMHLGVAWTAHTVGQVIRLGVYDCV